jgi:hypothetical protein
MSSKSSALGDPIPYVLVSRLRISAALFGVAAVSMAWGATPHNGPSPRTRAAYGMLLSLRDYASEMVRVDASSHQFTKDGCPRSIDLVTFSVAKTDPWGSSFLLRCSPHLAVGSPGPDRREGTADDLWSDQPLIEIHDACARACKKARACSPDPKSPLVARWCDAQCGGSADEAFYADTCTLLQGCRSALECLESSTSGHGPVASCADFGKAAAHAMKRPNASKKLAGECERDALRVHELVCVAASASRAELVRCFLTVNRDNVAGILSQ